MIGFEPSDDMREVALAKWEAIGKPSNLTFENRLSHELGIPLESTDIVTCSQSFHWMEPHSTLCEFARVLRPEGIFAAYDYDWPPVCDWKVDDRYQQLITYADKRANLYRKPLPGNHAIYSQGSANRNRKNSPLTSNHVSGLFRLIINISVVIRIYLS